MGEACSWSDGLKPQGGKAEEEEWKGEGFGLGEAFLVLRGAGGMMEGLYCS